MDYYCNNDDNPAYIGFYKKDKGKNLELESIQSKENKNIDGYREVEQQQESNNGLLSNLRIEREGRK